MKMSWEEIETLNKQFGDTVGIVRHTLTKLDYKDDLLCTLIPSSESSFWSVYDRFRWMVAIRGKALKQGWDMSVEDAEDFVETHGWAFANCEASSRHFEGLKYKYFFEKMKEGMSEFDERVFQMLHMGIHPNKWFGEGMPKWYYMLKSYGEYVRCQTEECTPNIDEKYFEEVVKPYLEEVEQTLKTVKEI